MSQIKIPYFRFACQGNELAYVSEVLAGGWLTTGAKALALENEFAAFIGAGQACAVNSGTAALHLALEACGVSAGDQVFVPTMTFTASAEIVRYLGADPVFLDVDYGSVLLTPDIVIQAIAQHPGVKALIVVHYGGQAATMTTPSGRGILDICNSHGLALIEDAAHAFPAKQQGRFVGTFGRAACFSFYANKTITSAEGGMLISDDKELIERSRVMRLHGIDRDIWKRFTVPGTEWEYDVIAPGFKYNMSDINAAIGLAQLERAAEMRLARQRCALFYLDALAGIEGLDLPRVDVPPSDHAWHLFPVVLNPKAALTRNHCIELLAACGIGSSVHYKPLHRMTYYRQRYNLRPDDFPNAEKIWQGTLSLPIYPDLSDDELDYICRNLRRILAS